MNRSWGIWIKLATWRTLAELWKGILGAGWSTRPCGRWSVVLAFWREIWYWAMPMEDAKRAQVTSKQRGASCKASKSKSPATPRSHNPWRLLSRYYYWTIPRIGWLAARCMKVALTSLTTNTPLALSEISPRDVPWLSSPLTYSHLAGFLGVDNQWKCTCDNR